jgi:amidohydrolase
MSTQPKPAPWAETISKHKPNLKPYEDLYKHFHTHPELSTQEAETASKITSHLKSLSSDLKIQTSIGGHGQIATLHNGDGPTILLRADIDALPVEEKSGVPYASTAHQVDNRDNRSKPTMHACGHDFHITSMLACVETLLSCRDSWAGTIVFLFQPAEERGSGAQAMIDDGLYDAKKHACPIPDVVLGQHVFPMREGVVTTKPGVIMSASDSIKITIHGRGGHGSMPHYCIDPVVIASTVVMKLQTIVSREIAPTDMAVVTVGSLQAGEAENVIPAEAVLKVNVRTVDEEVRKHVKGAIERIVRAECQAGNCPKEPEFETLNTFPLTTNDHDTALTVAGALKLHFGDKYLDDMKGVSGSEDFGLLGSAIGKPYCFWFFGGIEGGKWDKLEKEGNLKLVPVNHSPFFAPALEMSLKTGVEAMCVAALTFVGKK